MFRSILAKHPLVGLFQNIGHPWVRKMTQGTEATTVDTHWPPAGLDQLTDQSPSVYLVNSLNEPPVPAADNGLITYTTLSAMIS